jgi:hypothetical protein
MISRGGEEVGMLERKEMNEEESEGAKETLKHEHCKSYVQPIDDFQ